MIQRKRMLRIGLLFGVKAAQGAWIAFRVFHTSKTLAEFHNMSPLSCFCRVSKGVWLPLRRTAAPDSVCALPQPEKTMAVLLLRQAPVGIILSGRGCRAERLADFQILLRFSKLRNCSSINQKMFMQISNLSLQIFPLRYNKTKNKLLQYKNPMDSMVLDRREIPFFFTAENRRKREKAA